MPAAPLVGRRDDAAAGGVLLVDRERVEVDPVQHRAAGRACGLRTAGELPVQLGARGAAPCRPPGSTPSVAHAARDALLHDAPRSSSRPARSPPRCATTARSRSMMPRDRLAGLACSARAARRRCGTGARHGVVSGTITVCSRRRPRRRRSRRRPSSTCAPASSRPSRRRP